MSRYITLRACSTTGPTPEHSACSTPAEARADRRDDVGTTTDGRATLILAWHCLTTCFGLVGEWVLLNPRIVGRRPAEDNTSAGPLNFAPRGEALQDCRVLCCS